MTKQERRTKSAPSPEAVEATATKIISEAVEKVAARRARPLPQELLDHAPAIKTARENGVAWWKVANTLNLPGSADTVARGKAGASMARRIYAAAYGALPAKVPSERTHKKRAEKDPNVKALRETKVAERVEQVRAGKSVIPNDLPDAEVLAMLKGRVLTWTINLNDFDGKGDSFADDSAIIHPRYMRIEIHGGDRCIAFREIDPTAHGDARNMPGPTRVVRLSKIHTVR